MTNDEGLMARQRSSVYSILYIIVKQKKEDGSYRPNSPL